LRHAQDADGRDALPDEDATARRYRDGAARPCLQSHPRHEHRWHSTAHGSNEGIARDICASLSAETPLRPRSSHRLKGQSVSAPPGRFRTTKTLSGCRPSKLCALRDALYWITSSAMANSVSGIVKPRALAVLRLMMNSNLVGCCTGRSEGLAPLRIRPTY